MSQLLAIQPRDRDCMALTLDFVPICKQGAAFADACSNESGKLSYVTGSYEDRRGAQCACGNPYEKLSLSAYLSDKNVFDVDAFRRDCELVQQVNRQAGDPMKRCADAGGTMTGGSAAAAAIGNCICTRTSGGKDYLCSLEDSTSPPYSYTNCKDADLSSLKCSPRPASSSPPDLGTVNPISAPAPAPVLEVAPPSDSQPAALAPSVPMSDFTLQLAPAAPADPMLQLAPSAPLPAPVSAPAPMMDMRVAPAAATQTLETTDPMQMK